MTEFDLSAHPAAYENWARRCDNKLRHDWRKDWQQKEVSDDTPRIAALVHIYYLDLVPDILSHLASIPLPFDLIVTNASGKPLAITQDDIGQQVRDIRVLEVPNRGRDILPLISVVNAGLLEPYELVVKVHTKKSPWRETQELLAGDGDEWREAFLDQLLGTEEKVKRILAAFAEDPSIGLITADDCLLGPEYWASNRKITADLLKRVELEVPPSLHFASGSMYWVQAFILNGFRALDLTEEDFDLESGQNDGTTAHAIERLIGILGTEAGFTLQEFSALPTPEFDDSWSLYSPNSPRVAEARVVPFYLPQFHAFPENDAWWGKGFTEWSNLTASQPMFLGHRQPSLPADLGFYDLSNRDVRPRQYELALDHGIAGFMYYHYWFEGKQLMHTPVEDLVQSEDAHPFCLMWANENWTRRWDGLDAEVLIAQNYDVVSADQYIDDIRHLLEDPRYIRIDGKPLLAVYRINQIPNYRQTIAHWRKRAEDFGLPGLVLLAVDLPSAFDGLEGGAQEAGLDGLLEFPPHNRRAEPTPESVTELRADFDGGVYSYKSVVDHGESDLFGGLDANRYPGVLVCFDNTPRRGAQASIMYGSNPFTFRRWLRTAVLGVQSRPEDARVIFVNAWNEWAEGAVLEPSQRFGSTYLQAVKSAVFSPDFPDAPQSTEV